MATAVFKLRGAGVLALLLTAAAMLAVLGAHAVRGTRKVWVGAQSAYVDVPVYERESLAVGQVLAGPGVIQEASSTLVLPAGSRATVDASGSIVVDLGIAPGFTPAPSAGGTAAVQ